MLDGGCLCEVRLLETRESRSGEAGSCSAIEKCRGNRALGVNIRFAVVNTSEPVSPRCSSAPSHAVIAHWLVTRLSSQRTRLEAEVLRVQTGQNVSRFG
jgi:hypothetical protein